MLDMFAAAQVASTPVNIEASVKLAPDAPERVDGALDRALVVSRHSRCQGAAPDLGPARPAPRARCEPPGPLPPCTAPQREARGHKPRHDREGRPLAPCTAPQREAGAVSGICVHREPATASGPSGTGFRPNGTPPRSRSVCSLRPAPAPGSPPAPRSFRPVGPACARSIRLP